MYDFTFGLSATVWIALAILLGVIGSGLIGSFGTDKQRKFMKVGAVACALIASVALGFWATTPDPDETTLVPEGAAEWDVAVTLTSAASTHIIKMSDYSFKVLVNTDVTGVGAPFPVGNITGWCNLTVTTNRADTNINPAFVLSKITDYGTSTNITSGMTYDGVAKAASGDWRTTYTDSAAAVTTDQIMQPIADTMRADTYAVTILANVNAVVAQPLNGGYTVTLLASGVPVTIEFVHDTNT